MRTPVLAIPLFLLASGLVGPVARAAEAQTGAEAPPQVSPLPVPEPVPQPIPQALPQTTPQSAPQPILKPEFQSSPLPTQAPTPPPANDQVIEPQVDRRQVKVPHIPSNNYEVGIFGGAYNTEHFGTNAVGGARLGYHITEDAFVEAVYGQTKVSDSTYRLFLPGGIFPVPEEILRYYELTAGYNLLPGEFFIGRTHAKVAALYLVAGLGTTKFDGSSHETVALGFGTRLFLADWVALQVDLRDHAFSMDILGQKKDTQNIEVTAGVTFFF